MKVKEAESLGGRRRYEADSLIQTERTTAEEMKERTQKETPEDKIYQNRNETDETETENWFRERSK